MRSYKPIPELIDQQTKLCMYSKCKRTFFTDNVRAKFCCDSHREKFNRELNQPIVSELKTRNVGFMRNAQALKHLFEKGITIVNERDLIIAGFDLEISDLEKSIADGRKCLQYMDYLLIPSADKQSFEIDKISFKKE